MPTQPKDSATQRNVKDFKSFYRKFVDRAAEKRTMENYIFRGEDSDDYQLYPGALRESGVDKLKLLAGKGAEKYQKGSELEATAIANFYRHANRHGLYVPNLEEFAEYNRTNEELYTILWKKDILQPKFYELYALAQHYYVPTRFLDWSFDIHVALWFAAYGSHMKQKNRQDRQRCQGFALWVMNYKRTKEIQVAYPEGSSHQANMQSVTKEQNKNKDRYLKFVVPPYANNANLRAQKGILTYLPVQRFVEKEKHGEYYGESLDKCILKTAEEESKRYADSGKEILYLRKYVFPAEQAQGKIMKKIVILFKKTF